MSIFSKLIAAALGAALLLTGSAASAAKYEVAFSGLVTSGTDSGLFGPPADLTGKSFVVTYYLDLSKDFRDINPGVYDIGWAQKVSINIGGSTQVIPTYPYYDSYQMAKVGSLEFGTTDVVEANPLAVWSVGNKVVSPWFQPTLDFGGSAIIFAAGTGSFGMHQCCCPSCGDDFPDISVRANFSSDKVTITAVPEPATWGLMITGFGMAGAALRRRRAVAA